MSRIYTVWGGRLRKMFCNIFSESSTGSWAELQLPCCPSKQWELPENIIRKTFYTTCRHRLYPTAEIPAACCSMGLVRACFEGSIVPTSFVLLPFYHEVLDHIPFSVFLLLSYRIQLWESNQFNAKQTPQSIGRTVEALFSLLL